MQSTRIERIVCAQKNKYSTVATENLHFAPLYQRNETIQPGEDEVVWVVMRSKRGGYHEALDKVYEFFMPMKESIVTRGGQRVKRVTPAIPDVFFAKDSIAHLEELVHKNQGIEFLYIKGLPYRQPVVIRDSEMDNFIAATKSNQRVTFCTAGDDTLARIVGRRVRISHSGSEIEGELITVRGSRYRRLRVRLHDCIVAYLDLTLTPTTIVEIVE